MAIYSPSASRQRTLALQRRSFEFTCSVIRGYPATPSLDEASRIVWRQLIRAATSSTFNLEEADAASSDADFLAKMRIATREAKEAHVALRLITRCQLAGSCAAAQLQDEANQLAAILVTIVKNRAAKLATQNS